MARRLSVDCHAPETVLDRVGTSLKKGLTKSLWKIAAPAVTRAPDDSR
eukprot:CAMPEP_0195062030 /NCGR_PEP_ID=MMETSP0448-20130528/8755_1 /TAXON_ID=66468 /ORGANISM="Heterocapsa triquestra, Strain CCMP 448" /LENGTH=47 /DNA_ID= /DNA_START= /DNA_END= /DNA_ORIENTATION=